MTRTSLADIPCSVARATDVLGDKWVLLILRDAFAGVRSFSGFQKSLGLSRKVLSQRLKLLVENGVFSRVQPKPDVDRHHYLLTEKGRALFPLITALGQWGDAWIFGEGGEPIRAYDQSTGAPIAPLQVRSTEGAVLAPQDIAYAPGPGADGRVRKAFGAGDQRTKGPVRAARLPEA